MSDGTPGRLVLATRNAGKIRELKAFLAGMAWEICTCLDYPQCPIPVESGSSFEENARIKAETVSRHTGEIALADDSGLEVDALSGAPGVYSARFAGEKATDQENNTRLLALLKNVPLTDRTARFRCVIAVARPGGDTRTFSGVCEGRIACVSSGTGGFGYDPLFVAENYTQSFGELTDNLKARISHRARAFALVAAFIRTVFP